MSSAAVDASRSMPAAMPPIELTLIVAATRSMGIGRGGTLPWTGLKQEMAYFARITKRLPTSAAGLATDSVQAAPPRHNTVIMGRKTWESIPPKFRPLRDRHNIVLSRAAPAPSSTADDPRAARWLPSLRAAVDALAREQAADPAAPPARVFVIGGAEIYRAALQMREAKRVLLTRVLSDFDCDTVFPVRLGGDRDVPEKTAAEQAWLQRTKEDLDQWTGETVPEGVREENGTQYIFEMYERA